MPDEQTNEQSELATAPTLAPPAEQEVPATFTREQVDNILAVTYARAAEIDNARYARMFLLVCDPAAVLGYTHGVFNAFASMATDTIDGEYRTAIARAVVTAAPTVPAHDEYQRQTILSLARAALVILGGDAPQRDLVRVFALAQTLTEALAGRTDLSRDPDAQAAVAAVPPPVATRAAEMVDAFAVGVQAFEASRAPQPQ
jgi:hypothetical protein